MLQGEEPKYYISRFAVADARCLHYPPSEAPSQITTVHCVISKVFFFTLFIIVKKDEGFPMKSAYVCKYSYFGRFILVGHLLLLKVHAHTCSF